MLDRPRELQTTAAEIVDLVRCINVTRAEAISLVESWGHAQRLTGETSEAFAAYSTVLGVVAREMAR